MTIQKTTYKTKKGDVTREYKYDKDYEKHYRWTTKDGLIWDCVIGHPETKKMVGYRTDDGLIKLIATEEESFESSEEAEDIKFRIENYEC